MRSPLTAAIPGSLAVRAQRKVGAWTMVWTDLLFLHWRVPENILTVRLPEGVQVDTFDGSAWLGVIPFSMTVHPSGRHLPRWLSEFPEINVRTYVRYRGEAGVWFFSLDVPNPLAAAVARLRYRLPYYVAKMRVKPSAEGIEYDSRRAPGQGAEARFHAVYRPEGETMRALPGSLDAFLTERYVLFTHAGGGRIGRAAIHHAPWRLAPARVELHDNSMAEPLGLSLGGPPQHVRYAARTEVEAGPLERIPR